MSLRPCYVFIFSCVILLSSCGGGGGGSSATNPGNTDSLVTSATSSVSSTSSSASSESLVLAPDDQSFSVDEDGILSAELKTNFDYIGGSTEKDKFKVEGSTTKGGRIKIVTPESADPKLYLEYAPAEDFNGDDQVVVYLSKFTNGIVGNTQPVKLNFKVRPIVDENLKIKITNEKIFSSGEKINLSLPYHPDTNLSVPSDTPFKLSIDDVPVNYSVDATGIVFTIPSTIPAGVNKLSVDFDDKNIHQRLNLNLNSKIDYGDIEYWFGDKDRPGVTYVVMAENSVNQQTYLNWVNTEFSKLFKEPLISGYSGYWNIAVIKQPASENYARYFEGASDKILVADLKLSGELFIKKYITNYDGVILNTALEGRATGGYPMTLHLNDIRTILHEFGHVHAKLADEYADEAYIPDPVYTEGSNPNVTNYNQYDLIPWKHWILDKNAIPGVVATSAPNSVGAFLGAFYSPNRFYRPMMKSIMIDPSAPFGPVNSEAWVLANYEHMGILNSVTTQKTANIRTITIGKNWNKDTTKISWFIDGAEQTAWANQAAISIDETRIATASYSVKAELTDLLGYIKNPHAYPAFKKMTPFDVPNNEKFLNENFVHTWTFEKSATQTKLQKQNAILNSGLSGKSWVDHTVNIAHGVHQLLASFPYNVQDTVSPVTARSEFVADIIDASGHALYSVGVDNPYVYYHGEAGQVVVNGRGSYKIKHPQIEGPYKIKITDLHNNQVVAIFNISK